MLKQVSFLALYVKYYNNVHSNMLYIHNNAFCYVRLKYRTQFPAHNLHVATSFVFSPEYITLAVKANGSSVLLSFALASLSLPVSAQCGLPFSGHGNESLIDSRHKSTVELMLLT